LRTAVVLFNLGGPDSLEAVEPFLRNLFSDPAIIDLPKFLRTPIARFAAKRRAPVAREIYAKLGGSSPINEETRKQASALEAELAARGIEAKAFVAMRCWRPLISDAAREVVAWSPDKIVLLPLYPQYSTTTTGSSFTEWDRMLSAVGLKAPTTGICCYPASEGFIAAIAALVQDTLTRRKQDVDYRVLFSAHGLPKRTVSRGDPYRWQTEQTAQALVERLGTTSLDWRLTYQSRVGPLEWIGPSTDSEIRNAAREGRGIVIVPIAFVSEHSETLVELDIEYAKLARDCGAPDFLRVQTVGVHSRFIGGLADLVARAVGQPAGLDGPRRCPTGCARCPQGLEG
jgi:ferrochelatase